MSRNPYSKKREDFIHKQTELLNKRIDRAQNRLLELILAKFIDSLQTDENGQLISNDKIIFLPSRLDKAYDEFVDEELKPLMEGFVNNVNKLIGYNKKYFDEIKKSENHKSIKEQVLSAIGIGGGVVLGGSLLFEILSNRDVASTVKSVVMTGVSSGLSITSLKTSVIDIMTKREGGVLKSLFERTLGDPYVKVDRYVGGKYAVDLKLDYAIYQGGIIKSSREFCIERNNKVFSRDEIMKFGTPYDRFGGYSDKSNGEFQGKNEPYNPLVDLGGFNCRHQFDWISDELAFHLRPDLRGKKISAPVNPQLN